MKHIPILNPDELEMLPGVMEAISPSTFPRVEDRERPYNGQPQTVEGERGRTIVRGLSFRDVRDCFIRGCFMASGLSRNEWPDSVYDLPWHRIDIIAVQQNMSCEMERLMGIFPNVPGVEPRAPEPQR